MVLKRDFDIDDSSDFKEDFKKFYLSPFLKFDSQGDFFKVERNVVHRTGLTSHKTLLSKIPLEYGYKYTAHFTLIKSSNL